MDGENFRDELFDSGLRLSLEDEEVVAAVSQLSDDEEEASENVSALEDAVVAAREELESVVAAEIGELESLMQYRTSLENELLTSAYPALVAEVAARLRDSRTPLDEILATQRGIQDEIDAVDHRVAEEDARQRAAEVERVEAAAQEAVRQVEASIEQLEQGGAATRATGELRGRRRRWRRRDPRSADIPHAVQEPDPATVKADLRERRNKLGRSMADLTTAKYRIDLRISTTEREAARQELQEHPELLEVDRRFAALTQTARQSLVEKAIKPYCRNWLSEGLDRKLHQRYSSVLAVEFSGGLGERASAEQEVPTSAHARLQRLLDQLPGGSIGISGPRGSGKSTLIRSFCSDSRTIKGQPPVLAINVSAPVDYAPRDFVLHLFAMLCNAAIRRSGLSPRGARLALDDDALASGQPRLLELAPKVVGVVAVAACLTGTGLAVSRVAQGAVDTTHEQVLWSAVALLAATLLWVTLRWSWWARVPESPRLAMARNVAFVLAMVAFVVTAVAWVSGWPATPPDVLMAVVVAFLAVAVVVALGGRARRAVFHAAAWSRHEEAMRLREHLAPGDVGPLPRPRPQGPARAAGGADPPDLQRRQPCAGARPTVRGGRAPRRPARQGRRPCSRMPTATSWPSTRSRPPTGASCARPTRSSASTRRSAAAPTSSASSPTTPP